MLKVLQTNLKNEKIKMPNTLSKKVFLDKN